jgi:hypothetical protein
LKTGVGAPTGVEPATSPARRGRRGVRVRSGLVGGAGDGAGLSKVWVAEGLSTGFGGGQSGLRALRDHRPLFLGQRREQMQHEGISVGAELDADKRHALRHEAGDESDIATQPIELCDHDRALLPVSARFGQGGAKLRAAVERVGALARLDLSELGGDLEALSLGEAGDGGALGVEPEPRAALFASARCSRTLSPRRADRAIRRRTPRGPDVLMDLAACERRRDFSRPCGAVAANVQAAGRNSVGFPKSKSLGRFSPFELHYEASEIEIAFHSIGFAAIQFSFVCPPVHALWFGRYGAIHRAELAPA